MNKWDVFTLQKFGVYEQLQGEEENHQDDARHQDTVEAWAEETELPQGHLTTTARLQPVGPTEKNKTTCLLFMVIDTHHKTYSRDHQLVARGPYLAHQTVQPGLRLDSKTEEINEIHLKELVKEKHYYIYISQND